LPWLSCNPHQTATAPCRRANRIARPFAQSGSSIIACCDRLAAQAEALDELGVTRPVGLLEIVEKAATLADKLEKAAAGMVVLGVALEVLGQVGDALGEDRDLDFRR